MNLRLPGRLLAVTVLLAVVMVAVSGFLELTSAARLALRHAAVESDLVTGAVRRELGRLVDADPSLPLTEAGRDPGLHRVLRDALALAPSVLHVAVLDPVGIVAAHSDTTFVGSTLAPLPALPAASGFRGNLTMLWRLHTEAGAYQMETDLLLGDVPYATIRVVIPSAFLWDAVRAAASRGMAVAMMVVGLAIAAGMLLSRLVAGRVRPYEAWVASVREGRPAPPLPADSGEFAHLARELDLLGRYLEARHAEESRVAPQAGNEPDTRLDPSRAIARVGEAASGVAHELRNHLQAVKLELEALLRSRDLDRDTIDARLAGALEGLESLDGTVRGFLKIVRIRPLAPERLDVNQLLATVREDYFREAQLAGIELEIDPTPGVSETWGDPEVLRGALGNLVRNATQALVDRSGHITLRARRQDSWLVLSVSDDGPGIPPTVLERVFDLYFTTRKDGAGVGLALVRQAAELHGGEIDITTSPESGTTVALKLPALRAALEGSQLAAAAGRS